MVWYILVAIGFFAGALLLALRFVFGFKGKNKRSFSYAVFFEDDLGSFIGLVLAVVSLVIFIILFISTLVVRDSNRIEYEQKVILRDSLVMLMEDTKDDYKDSVYAAVVDFNRSVAQHQAKQHSFNHGIEYPDGFDWEDIPLIVPKGEYDK